MAKINYDKFIKYLIEHSTSDEFKNALYAQGLYFDNDELKQIEYKPKFKIGDRITDGRWIFTVKDMDLFSNLYSLDNNNGYKTKMVFSYIDKEYKLVENTTENTTTSIELTEPENERIREKLINLVKMSNEAGGFALHKWEADEMLAWLEKQNKPKEYTFKSIPCLLDMIEPTERAKAYTKKLINTLTDEGYITDAKIVEECLKQMNGEDVAMAVMDEKQDEQKETLCDECKKAQYSHSCQDITALGRCYIEGINKSNKVEPKFNIGDWIINRTDGTIMEIINNKNFYESIEISGQRRTDTYNHVEWNFRLWSIADAKDGDILSWDDSKCIALFKNIYDEDSFNSHGFVGHWTNIFESRLAYHDIEGAHPATKEQRDLLFIKMHEAGYEWNANKKELKIIDWSKHIKYEPNSPSIIEQKSIWSEKDKEMINKIIDYMQPMPIFFKSTKGKSGKEYTKEFIKDAIKWLKSLKKIIEG